MTINEITPLMKEGKTAMLPSYEGYFKWDYSRDIPIFINGDYLRELTENELTRTDWYYII